MWWPGRAVVRMHKMPKVRSRPKCQNGRPTAAVKTNQMAAQDFEISVSRGAELFRHSRAPVLFPYQVYTPDPSGWIGSPTEARYTISQLLFKTPAMPTEDCYNFGRRTFCTS